MTEVGGGKTQADTDNIVFCQVTDIYWINLQSRNSLKVDLNHLMPGGNKKVKHI